MVFYNKILRAYVLIELKTTKLTPEAAGQLNMYLNYYAAEVNDEHDNPPIGIILCTAKDSIAAEYALGGLSNNISTNLPFDDVYQMVITNILPDEALIIDEADNCQKKTCDMCGKAQYWIDGTYQLKVKGDYLSTEHDVYSTNKLFGAGFARREIIVSRRFYDLIQANKLGRTLHFEPILID